MEQELPEYDETLKCPTCPPGMGNVFLGMYGLFGGGGPGRYTLCSYCGQVISKSCDTHKEQVNEPTEIKTPDVQDTDPDQP